MFLGVLIFSCSEEIVPVIIQDRSELDSLETVIGVTTDDITAAQIANDSLKRYADSLNAVLKELKDANTSLPQVVEYTLQITDGSQGYINGRTASLAGAVVTVSQGNFAQELTTDGTGFVTFPELEDGFISVTVEVAGYSDVYLVVDLRDGGSDGTGSPDVRYAATQVMVFPTSGNDLFTLTGRSYYNQDLNNLRTGDTNDPFHPYEGSQIYETVPTGTTWSLGCTPSSIPNQTVGRPGFVVSAIYAGLQRVASTDVNGNWTMTLPVVLLTTGNNLFSYSFVLSDQIEGTRINVAPTPNSEEVWAPLFYYPLSIFEMQIFPGGNGFTDLYYEPI